MPEEEKTYYTIPEVAVILGVNYLAARYLIKKEKIKTFRSTNIRNMVTRTVVSKEDLIKYINETVRVKNG